MKRFLTAIALTVGLAAHASTVTGFTGPFDPANWIQTIQGDGAISVSATSVSLTSPSTGGTTTLSITADRDMAISFDWFYTTDDDPFFERFGYVIDNVYADLSDPFGGSSQSGSAGIVLELGQTFGLRAWAVDDLGGPATTRVTNFAAQVPEPPALVLAALLALSLVGVARRAR